MVNRNTWTGNLAAFVVISAVIFIGAACQKKTPPPDGSTSTFPTNLNTSVTPSPPSGQDNRTGLSNAEESRAVRWADRGQGYEPLGPPPPCPDPLVLTTPVDLTKVYSILYPGQVRGDGFRAHGGFRFDGYAGDIITVLAPIDGDLVQASRYLESGYEQLFLTFIHPCGLMYRFDHLVKVDDRIQTFIDTLPPARPNDSRTTPVDPPISFRTGEVIATAVGAGTNVFVDFGVYDLRQENEASRDPDWRATHPTEYERHGVCWFDLLSSADAIKVRSARAGGTDAGAESDYCR